MSTCILLMTKAPRAGDVKSRLASVLGWEQAAGLYRCFLLDILDTLNESGIRFIVYYTPADALDELKTLLGPNNEYVLQEGGNLGERLYHGMVWAKEMGYRGAIALASDVPDITVDYLADCVDSLGRYSAVIGPSIDGGYNLIGLDLDCLDMDFFSGITWETSSVYEETLDKLGGLNVYSLALLGDVDNESDLENLCMSETSHTMKYLRKLHGS